MKTIRVGLKPLKYVSPFKIITENINGPDAKTRYIFVHEACNISLYHYWLVDKYIFDKRKNCVMCNHIMTLEEAEEIINEHYRYNEVK